YRASGDPFDEGTTPTEYYSTVSNAFGLFDVAGNAAEWCWDRYEASPAVDEVDPKGPDTGTDRLVRGGAWWLNAPSPYTTRLRCGDRTARLPPANGFNSVGFRTVRQY
ncbi:MAG: SUMF1/EgtB/PvdO family nonheme iron enzyme, partial [Lentisphaerae bacterium]|nr:SUMF1/EgtB/PvdO family nonheme iron enzyme [Lentisphaerota bacterium]